MKPRDYSISWEMAFIENRSVQNDQHLLPVLYKLQLPDWGNGYMYDHTYIYRIVRNFKGENFHKLEKILADCSLLPCQSIPRSQICSEDFSE